MQPVRGSLFTFAAGRRAKWIVFAIWFIAILIAAGPADLPGKFEEAENNEASSYLPGDAESTAALEATDELQDGELAPAVVLFRRESGLTAADRRTLVEDVKAMSAERFPGVIADGETAAAGGRQNGTDASRPSAPRGLPAGCTGPTAAVPGQPADYAPFVGPICSADGKAAIVIAYIKAEGEGERITDPVKAWREDVADPPPGLAVKITGGAGFSADAIEVFEGLNGTLLLAAVSLVVFLLIVIYRSPMFFLIPLAAVLFAETLSRSIGYGVSELGVTINGQSSSIMSVLVLGAGTDYALLLVARYREELHNTADKHEAMRTALASAGPAIFASAATVIAALLCLLVARVNGTAGLGPIAAIGIGAIAAVPSYYALLYRVRTRLDDSLDVVAAHGVGGITGALLLLTLPEAAFQAIVPVLIALACVLVVLQPRLAGWLRKRSGERHPHGGPLLYVAIYGAGIYGGDA